MSRLASRTAQHLVDLTVLSLALMLGFLLRFDGDPPYAMVKRMLFLLPYVALFEFGVLRVFGVHRFAWRYIGLREAARIFAAVAAASVVFTVGRFVAAAWLDTWAGAQYALIPLGVIATNFALAFLGITGVRVLRRLWIEKLDTSRHQRAATGAARTLLIGAGRAGVNVARELARRPDLGLKALGFLDDDAKKLGTLYHGIEVLGTTAQLDEICRRHRVEQVVITIAAASGATIRRLANACDAVGLTAKIIPGISEILDGKVNLTHIREVSIEDLLGREAVHFETDLVGKMLAGRVVVVTGAGGSIGSELCRQIARVAPRELVLVERAEPALFEIFHELRGALPAATTVHPVLCDVQDAERVRAVFDAHRPDVVFHAAAHKHVPLMEYNPGEAVKNNVFGTRNVADAADRFGVETFVLISTDKAVNPTSIMGATKRVAEVYLQALARRSETRYVAVRFGNVLGSTGSVIPIFKAQIKAGGPVTVTHPEMQRYFMTIPEASQLVMQAGAMGQGGEIFVLDMGEPVHIVDLARDLIRLSGLEPGVDVAITFVGVRPGEKLFEEFCFDAERMDKTRHPKIFVGKLAPSPWDEVVRGLEGLAAATGATTRAALDAPLRVLVPEMQAPEPLGDVGASASASSSAAASASELPASPPAPAAVPVPDPSGA